MHHGEHPKSLSEIERIERIYSSRALRIGLVIGTFGCVPYVHLHLESRSRNYPRIPVLVHDDCSTKSAELASLSATYNVIFSSNQEHLGHNLGDLSVYEAGFTWASEMGLDILVKMSRRFIPLINWVPELESLAHETQYSTFSNKDVSEGLGFRTECVGFHVPTWIQLGLASEISRQVSCKQCDEIMIEAVIHGLARRAQESACAMNLDYLTSNPRPHESNGYGIWNMIGTDRRARLPYFLWHHACDAVEYCRALLQFGIRYSMDEWLDLNG